MGFSYAAIKGGVTALLQRAEAAGRAEPGDHHPKARVARLLARFIGRYLVVGVVAWAVLVPLKAHPLGLFAGVTVPVLAIGIEAVRLNRRRPAPGR
jgi:Flp pilus assembly protein TadB